MSKLIKPCKKVITRDKKGKINGWLLEIVSARDGFTENIKGQVYLTTALPGMIKGFHLHKHKIDHFTCIKGNIKLVLWDGKKFCEYLMGEDNFITVKIPPETPHAIYNYSKEEAYVINYCYPAYDPANPDQEEWEGGYKWEKEKKSLS